MPPILLYLVAGVLAAWLAASLPAEAKTITYDQVILIPLGQFLQSSASRKSLTGVLGGPATPVFWKIEKTE